MKETDENIMDAEATEQMAQKNISDKRDDGNGEDSEKSEPNTSTSSKKFDDSCFKTPMLPHKRGTGLPAYKKRTTNSKSNGARDSEVLESADDDKDNPISSSLCRLSIEGSDGKKDDNSLLDVFVSIGKDSYLCPRSRHYFASEFPGLPQKRSSNEEEDLLKEVIVDEFSLLLFSSVDDYDVLKMHEIEVKEREDAMEKRKTCEQNIRIGKIKKKGRKCKMDSEREKKREKREQKKREKLERREKRRIHKEQKEQLQRERQEHRDRMQMLSAEERLAEKRVYKKKKREALAENVGPSTSDIGGAGYAAGAAASAKMKDKVSEEERQLKRERKIKERLLKSQFKEAIVGESSNSVATLLSHASIIGKLEPHLTAISASTSSIHSASVNATTTLEGKHYADAIQMGLGDAPSSSPMAAATGINGLFSGAVASSSNDKADPFVADPHWSALIQSRESRSPSRQVSDYHRSADSSFESGACSAIASTSNAGNEVDSQIGGAVKRPASAIGIAQRNGIILGTDMDGRNGVISQSSDLPPLNKLRKLDPDTNDFLKSHQQLSSGISKAQTSSTNTNNNLLAKVEVKLENGFGHNNKINSSTVNSQRSTPQSKGAAATPLSADGAHGSLAPPSSASVIPFSSASSSLVMAPDGMPANVAKFMPPLGAADPSMAAIIQQLLGVPMQPSAAASSAGDPSAAFATNLLHQSLLMNHPELLMNLHHQQQRQQQLKNQKQPMHSQLPAANPLDSASNLMAAAAAINSGFPLIGIQQQFLQQQQQQLEDSQKQQNRLIGTASTLQKLDAAAQPISSAALLSGFPRTAPHPFLLHSSADPLLNGANLSLASQLAGVAMLGKTQKVEKWSDRHVSIANQIAHYTEMQKNLTPSALSISQQQQIASASAADLKSQQHLLQQRFIQQQLQQQQLLTQTKFDATSFLPGNSRQNPSEAASSSALSRKNSEIANNHYQQQLAHQQQHQGPSQQQQKRLNAGPTTTTTMGLTKQQQEQHKQQLIQMAALKQQQQQAAQQQSYVHSTAHHQQQQQQLQMEALKRLQQQNKTTQQQQQQQQQQSLMAQFQQQQIQLQQQQSRHKTTPTPSANSARPPTAKTHQQHAQSTQMASFNGVGPAAAASQVLSPSSFINSSLFYPGAPKLPPTSNQSSSLLVNLNESICSENRQQKSALPPPLPQHSNAMNLPPQFTATSAAAVPHNYAPTVSTAEALSALGLTQHLAYQSHLQQQQKQQYSRASNSASQQQFNALGFPIHTSLLGGAAVGPITAAGAENGSIIAGGSGGGSLTSGTSAQAHAAATAAALGGENSNAPLANSHNQLNLMNLQQQLATAAVQQAGSLTQGAAQQSNSINNPILAQMAMAQLMIQQLGSSNSTTNINNFNPLLPLQGQQQQIAANNFLASLGILSNPGTPSSTAQQIPSVNTTQLLPQFAALQQQTQQRAPPPPGSRFASSTAISTPSNYQQSSMSVALTTTTPATVPSTAPSTSATNLQQQQQDLLIQAALLHGIQSLETKHPQLLNNNDNTVALASVQQVQNRPPVQHDAELLCQQRQLFLADQLQQHQQILLERMGVAGGNARS